MNIKLFRFFNKKIFTYIFYLILLLPLKVYPKNYSGACTKEIHIKDFGGIGNGITNCTEAFQKASAYLQVNGGTLIIDPGTYIVGKQRLSGNFGAGSSWIAEPILSFRDAQKPIIISGYKAVLKAADGLKFGSFNPVSGKKDSLRKIGNRSDYYASAFVFINAIGCLSVTVKGITLDGNSGKLDIGPAFGEEGIQLAAIGIGASYNKNVDIADCYIHHCALDGILITWKGLKDTDPIYPHSIKNVKAQFNGRQGLSWVGGNDLTVINSEFSSTGKAYNNGLPVVSKPSAGIDIEIEESIIKNGNFINCRIYNNAGPGISSIGHSTRNINFKKCTFIGTTNSAAYPKSQGFSFDSCTFVGMVQRIYGSADKSKAISFKNCLFTMDKKRSPNGKVFGETWEFYEGQNVIFDNCVFDARTKRLPVFNTTEIVFLNCTFSQHSDKDFNGAAIFRGTTKFIMRGKGKLNPALSSFQGIILYNNQKSSDIKNIELQ
ncbi:MAG: hypothetical protein ABIU11_01350 [Chitinophagaceae bacterium]